MREKIALIFPGIGYHCDKPLLYYGKKLAKEYGYRIVEVNYGGFPANIRGNADLMKQSFNLAMAQTEEILAKEQLTGEMMAEADLLIISKSIGTAVAAAFQQKYGLFAINVYFTPVKETFQFIDKDNGIIFHGNQDPWADTGVVLEHCKKLHIPLEIIHKANHSLETGDCVEDLKIMAKVMNRTKEFVTWAMKIKEEIDSKKNRP